MSCCWVDILWHFQIKRHIYIYIHTHTHTHTHKLFDFYCNSTDWLPHDARSGCGDSKNRLQIVLHVFMIYMCVYICTSMYVCKCGYMLYVCVCVCVSMCRCIQHMCVYLCVCVYIYIYKLLNYFYVAPPQGFFRYLTHITCI